MRRTKLAFVSVVSTFFLSGCAVLSPGEEIEPATLAALHVSTEFEQDETSAGAPLPPEVVEALFTCSERVDLGDLCLSSGEEGRLRRCLRAEQRSFMHVTPLLVDWQVNWLKEKLADYRDGEAAFAEVDSGMALAELLEEQP